MKKLNTYDVEKVWLIVVIIIFSSLIIYTSGVMTFLALLIFVIGIIFILTVPYIFTKLWNKYVAKDE